MFSWTSRVAHNITTRRCFYRGCGSTPRLGTSICRRCGHLFKKKKKIHISVLRIVRLLTIASREFYHLYIKAFLSVSVPLSVSLSFSLSIYIYIYIYIYTHTYTHTPHVCVWERANQWIMNKWQNEWGIIHSFI